MSSIRVSANALEPALHEGDRLTSSEFLQRWEMMPSLKQSELIDGVVFMPSPVLHTHGAAHIALSAWLWIYQDATPGCDCGVECTWNMGPKDVPQPDIFLRLLPEFGGQSRVENGYATGAPELVVEVSGSSVSRDFGVKLELYRRAGVREYLTVLLQPRRVIWRQLVRGRYKEVASDEDGLVRSRVFPGLWLDPAALWRPKRSLRVAVEKGLKSEEHGEFVRRLGARKRRRQARTGEGNSTWH